MFLPIILRIPVASGQIVDVGRWASAPRCNRIQCRTASECIGKAGRHQSSPQHKPFLELLARGALCYGAWRLACGTAGWRNSIPQLSRCSLIKVPRRRVSIKAKPLSQVFDRSTLSTNVRTVVQFVIPGLGTALLAPLLDATDAAIVGRFGSVLDLASLSPSAASFDILGLCFLFLSAATAQQLSVTRGNKQYAAARSKLADMCCFTTVCGLAICCFMLRNHHIVLGMLTSPETLPAVAAPAAAYMLIRALAFPVQLLQLTLSAACMGALHDTVTPFGACMAGAAANLTLDIILIAGLGLGTIGAALGTASGNVVAVSMLAYALRSNRRFEPAFKAKSLRTTPGELPLLSSPLRWVRSLRPARMLPVINVAAPMMFFAIMQVVLMTFEVRMGSAFGAMSLAAHQIAYSIWRPIECLGQPVMEAGLSMLPAEKSKGGAAVHDRVRCLAQAILLVALCLATASAVLGYAMCRFVPFMFTANVAVAKEAAGLAWPTALSIFGLGIWHSNQGMMLATGRGRLLALLYTWNIFYFVAGTSIVLARKLTLFHSWFVFGSMHAVFALIINMVLRLPPNGVFSHAKMAQM